MAQEKIHGEIADSEHGQHMRKALEQVLGSGEAAGPGTSAPWAAFDLQGPGELIPTAGTSRGTAQGQRAHLKV